MELIDALEIVLNLAHGNTGNITAGREDIVAEAMTRVDAHIEAHKNSQKIVAKFKKDLDNKMKG